MSQSNPFDPSVLTELARNLARLLEMLASDGEATVPRVQPQPPQQQPSQPSQSQPPQPQPQQRSAQVSAQRPTTQQPAQQAAQQSTPVSAQQPYTTQANTANTATTNQETNHDPNPNPNPNPNPRPPGNDNEDELEKKTPLKKFEEAVQVLADVGLAFNTIKSSMMGLAHPFMSAINLIEEYNQQLIQSQIGYIVVTRQFNALGKEVTDFSTRLGSTRLSFKKLLDDLEIETQTVVGLTSSRLNNVLSNVILNSSQVLPQYTSKSATNDIDLFKKLTANLASTMALMQLPEYQDRQEIRSLLLGEVNNPDSVMAGKLSISRQEANKAIAENRFIDLIIEKTDPYREASTLASNTFTNITSNIQELMERAQRSLGDPLINKLTSIGGKIFEDMNTSPERAKVNANLSVNKATLQIDKDLAIEKKKLAAAVTLENKQQILSNIEKLEDSRAAALKGAEKKLGKPPEIYKGTFEERALKIRNAEPKTADTTFMSTLVITAAKAGEALASLTDGIFNLIAGIASLLKTISGFTAAEAIIAGFITAMNQIGQIMSFTGQVLNKLGEFLTPVKIVLDPILMLLGNITGHGAALITFILGTLVVVKAAGLACQALAVSAAKATDALNRIAKSKKTTTTGGGAAPWAEATGTSAATAAEKSLLEKLKALGGKQVTKAGILGLETSGGSTAGLWGMAGEGALAAAGTVGATILAGLAVGVGSVDFIKNGVPKISRDLEDYTNDPAPLVSGAARAVKSVTDALIAFGDGLTDITDKFFDDRGWITPGAKAKMEDAEANRVMNEAGYVTLRIENKYKQEAKKLGFEPDANSTVEDYTRYAIKTGGAQAKRAATVRKMEMQANWKLADAVASGNIDTIRSVMVETDPILGLTGRTSPGSFLKDRNAISDAKKKAREIGDSFTRLFGSGGGGVAGKIDPIVIQVPEDIGTGKESMMDVLNKMGDFKQVSTLTIEELANGLEMFQKDFDAESKSGTIGENYLGQLKTKIKTVLSNPAVETEQRLKWLDVYNKVVDKEGEIIKLRSEAIKKQADARLESGQISKPEADYQKARAEVLNAEVKVNLEASKPLELMESGLDNMQKRYNELEQSMIDAPGKVIESNARIEKYTNESLEIDIDRSKKKENLKKDLEKRNLEIKRAKEAEKPEREANHVIDYMPGNIGLINNAARALSGREYKSDKLQKERDRLVKEEKEKATKELDRQIELDNKKNSEIIKKKELLLKVPIPSGDLYKVESGLTKDLNLFHDKKANKDVIDYLKIQKEAVLERIRINTEIAKEEKKLKELTSENKPEDTPEIVRIKTRIFDYKNLLKTTPEAQAKQIQLEFADIKAQRDVMAASLNAAIAELAAKKKILEATEIRLKYEEEITANLVNQAKAAEGLAKVELKQAISFTPELYAASTALGKQEVAKQKMETARTEYGISKRQVLLERSATTRATLDTVKSEKFDGDNISKAAVLNESFGRDDLTGENVEKFIDEASKRANVIRNLFNGQKEITVSSLSEAVKTLGVEKYLGEINSENLERKKEILSKSSGTIIGGESKILEKSIPIQNIIDGLEHNDISYEDGAKQAQLLGLNLEGVIDKQTLLNRLQADYSVLANSNENITAIEKVAKSAEEATLAEKAFADAIHETIKALAAVEVEQTKRISRQSKLAILSGEAGIGPKASLTPFARNIENAFIDYKDAQADLEAYKKFFTKEEFEKLSSGNLDSKQLKEIADSAGLSAIEFEKLSARVNALKNVFSTLYTETSKYLDAMQNIKNLQAQFGQIGVGPMASMSKAQRDSELAVSNYQTALEKIKVYEESKTSQIVGGSGTRSFNGLDPEYINLIKDAAEAAASAIDAVLAEINEKAENFKRIIGESVSLFNQLSNNSKILEKIADGYGKIAQRAYTRTSLPNEDQDFNSLTPYEKMNFVRDNGLLDFKKKQRDIEDQQAMVAEKRELIEIKILQLKNKQLQIEQQMERAKIIADKTLDPETKKQLLSLNAQMQVATTAEGKLLGVQEVGKIDQIGLLQRIINEERINPSDIAGKQKDFLMATSRMLDEIINGLDGSVNAVDKKDYVGQVRQKTDESEGIIEGIAGNLPVDSYNKVIADATEKSANNSLLMVKFLADIKDALTNTRIGTSIKEAGIGDKKPSPIEIIHTAIEKDFKKPDETGNRIRARIGGDGGSSSNNGLQDLINIINRPTGTGLTTLLKPSYIMGDYQFDTGGPFPNLNYSRIQALPKVKKLRQDSLPYPTNVQRQSLGLDELKTTQSSIYTRFDEGIQFLEKIASNTARETTIELPNPTKSEDKYEEIIKTILDFKIREFSQDKPFGSGGSGGSGGGGGRGDFKIDYDRLANANGTTNSGIVSTQSSLEIDYDRLANVIGGIANTQNTQNTQNTSSAFEIDYDRLANVIGAAIGKTINTGGTFEIDYDRLASILNGSAKGNITPVSHVIKSSASTQTNTQVREREIGAASTKLDSPIINSVLFSILEAIKNIDMKPVINVKVENSSSGQLPPITSERFVNPSSNIKNSTSEITTENHSSYRSL